MLKPLVLSLSMLAVASSAQAATAESKAEARRIFEDIIAFRTSVGLGQVPTMVDYLSAKFRAAGFPAEDIHALPLGETSALVVRYRGSGKGGKRLRKLRQDPMMSNADSKRLQRLLFRRLRGRDQPRAALRKSPNPAESKAIKAEKSRNAAKAAASAKSGA